MKSLDTLGDFRVSGDFRPRLNFQWHSKIINRVTSFESSVPNSIPLSFLMGRKLRALLSKPFQVQIFFHNTNMFSEVRDHLVINKDSQIGDKKTTRRNLTKSFSSPDLSQSIFQPVPLPRVKRCKVDYV